MRKPGLWECIFYGVVFGAIPVIVLLTIWMLRVGIFTF